MLPFKNKGNTNSEANLDKLEMGLTNLSNYYKILIIYKFISKLVILTCQNQIIFYLFNLFIFLSMFLSVSFTMAFKFSSLKMSCNPIRCLLLVFLLVQVLIFVSLIFPKYKSLQSLLQKSLLCGIIFLQYIQRYLINLKASSVIL